MHRKGWMRQTERMELVRIALIWIGVTGLLACGTENPSRTAESRSESPASHAEPAPLETVSMEDEEIKTLEKASEISEDDAHRYLDETQKITDRHTSQIDELCKQKEKELMEIA